MTNKKQILAISGSVRENSSNLTLIRAITTLYKDELEINIFKSIEDLPHFNPDLDNDTPPDAVKLFRNRLREADGILICTPEYAMGLPGTLKNALDWTVSSCEFSHKPVVAITASSLGENAHKSLLLTLQTIEAKMDNDTQLLIPYIKTKMNESGEFTNKETQNEVVKLMDNFIKLLQS